MRGECEVDCELADMTTVMKLVALDLMHHWLPFSYLPNLCSFTIILNKTVTCIMKM